MGHKFFEEVEKILDREYALVKKNMRRAMYMYCLWGLVIAGSFIAQFKGLSTLSSLLSMSALMVLLVNSMTFQRSVEKSHGKVSGAMETVRIINDIMSSQTSSNVTVQGGTVSVTPPPQSNDPQIIDSQVKQSRPTLAVGSSSFRITNISGV